MQKKDFLILIIKLSGLYAGVTALFQIPGYMSYSFSYMDIESVIWTVLGIGTTVLLLWALIFNANVIVDVLDLDRGITDDRVEFGNLTADSIMKIGIFLIGGMMMASGIPGLLSDLFWAFKSTVPGEEFTREDKHHLGISIISVLGGFLLAANYNVVAKVFHKNGEKAEDRQD